MTPQIFLDCDGVLADFDTYAGKIFGLHPRHAEETLGIKRFWVDLQSHGGFYEKLPLMPEATKLFDAVAHLNPIILTGLPRGDWAEPQKLAWRDKHFPDTKMICCPSKDKRLHMKAGDVLIDDWPKYKPLWEEYGGKFILYQNADQALDELWAYLTPEIA